MPESIAGIDSHDDESSLSDSESVHNEDEPPISESDDVSDSGYDTGDDSDRSDYDTGDDSDRSDYDTGGDSDESADDSANELPDEVAEAIAWFNFAEIEFEDPFKNSRRIEERNTELQYFFAYCRKFPPSLELDPKFYVDHSALGQPGYEPPRSLSYGFGFSCDRLIRYAIHRGTLSSTPSDAEVYLSYHKTLDRLKAITGLKILQYRDTVHETYHGVLALCDNFTLESYEKQVPDERKLLIIDRIRKELRFPPWEQPMWFFGDD